ncbi:hypothetical protein G8O24_43925, partial [Bradyrhizobium sp. INPA01-394B]|nr:hypothetical protein [Bradyrhizobium campsiandrae]
NAATALDVAPHQIARHCDTVSLCLSKGLSAPAGAVLAGPRAVEMHGDAADRRHGVHGLHVLQRQDGAARIVVRGLHRDKT